MPETPTFGRYAEIPYDEMTPEQQEGYHSLLETRGPLGGRARSGCTIPNWRRRLDLSAGIFIPETTR